MAAGGDLQMHMSPRQLAVSQPDSIQVCSAPLSAAVQLIEK
jgi:hypothetical protein